MKAKPVFQRNPALPTAVCHGISIYGRPAAMHYYVTHHLSRKNNCISLAQNCCAEQTGAQSRFGLYIPVIEGGEALARVAQRGCGCPIPGSAHGQVEL